jgi:hypothetical protein
VNVVGGQAIVIPTLRADFIARAAEQGALAELLSGHQFLVSPMEAEDLLRVVEEPARLVGARLEDGLAKQMLHDTGHEPGVLPLLEHALLQMWEHRRPDNVLTFAAYTDIGGSQGALAQQAESVFARFSTEQQRLVRRVLLRLTQLGEGTEDTRRRATRKELNTLGDIQGAVEGVLKTLTDARLLVTTGDEEKNFVDIAHEALIRGWPRLRRWIQEDPSALRTHRRITEGAQEWDRLHRDEGVLFRGALLAVTQEWRAQHDQDLNTLEHEFLDASAALKVQEEDQERSRQEREREQLRRSQEFLSKNFWANGINANTQNKWLEASHYFARSAKEWPDPIRVKHALLSIQTFTKAIFLVSELRHDDDLWGASFNRDGSLILTWSLDHTARLWDAKAVTPVGQPLRHSSSVQGASFNRDSSLILTWSLNHTAWLWQAKTDTDFPPEHLPLLLEVITGTTMDDAGNLTVLNPGEWEKRKGEYVGIAEHHLITCQYRDVNLYLKQEKIWEGHA